MRVNVLNIPEQFTVKAHLALFEGEGSQEKVAVLFQSTIHRHIQNAQNNTKRRINFQWSV